MGYGILVVKHNKEFAVLFGCSFLEVLYIQTLVLLALDFECIAQSDNSPGSQGVAG